MKKFQSLLLFLAVFCIVNAQPVVKEKLISKADLDYLEGLTKAVMDSSRIYPGQKISNDFGANATGAILIRPGGRDSYPAFWIRDYAMSIETGFVKREEQKKNALVDCRYSV